MLNDLLYYPLIILAHPIFICLYKHFNLLCSALFLNISHSNILFLNISFSGSSLRGPISNAIIKLNEEGYISNLKDQWWKKEGTCAVGF